MDDNELVVCLLLLVWIIKRRLQAARRNRIETYRRLWEVIQHYDAEEERIQADARRRMRMVLLSQRPRRKPSVWAFKRDSEWWDAIVPSFTNTEWLNNFRMSEETLSFLCNKLNPVMERRDTSFHRCVPLKKRVAIALWKLATGSEYRTIAQLFGVSITTVCRCVQEFCAVVETLLVPEQIRFPDEENFREMAACFENRWGLPHCVGAIGGSHIPITAPQDCHCDYVNHEGWHSIILQGVVDGKGLWWNIFTGQPGSLDAANVLRMSTLWELANRGNYFPAHTRNIGGVTAGYYILGDPAYPLQNWLLKLFHDTGRLPVGQHQLNKKFIGARGVVENAFGRLRGRWRCLVKTNDCDLQLQKSMVMTCCALHNLCENRGETYEMEWDTPAAAVEPVVATAQGVEEEGSDVREGLMRYLLSNS
ncbi:protein ANTAGONIST OF LIKE HETEROCHROMATIN PROTEIN 1-like [Thalassophryne amazonica]|uniref:protein ANTAGONIST OF LIKE HETEROCHROMATIN PROTEIN 1-like n=1 Tax=Thalassophryne amazonica TaxID=390379 RepID=UPI0014712E62|nr:protein ANTAGONIST OF LIKE HETEROCHROMATIN PROTEIN 1-like [Thalassophryne amazonica]